MEVGSTEFDNIPVVPTLISARQNLLRIQVLDVHSE